MRLGDKLREARREKSLELIDVSRITRIPEKYLEAIEVGTFTILPKAKAHRVAYVREYAKILKLEPEDCLYQFEKEAGLDDTLKSHPHQNIKIFPFASISIFLRNILVGAVALSFAGYLMWQVNGVLQPPKLSVFFPSEGYVTAVPHTTIEGETEKESKLTVNGQEVMVNEQGKFSTAIDLSNGVNTVQILATKKHGKTTTITRHIVVKLPSMGGMLK